MFPSSITDELLSIVDSYHFANDSLKIQTLTELEKGFMDHLLTDILIIIPEDQRDRIISLCTIETAEAFVDTCSTLIPDRDDFIDESLESFKESMKV